MHRIVFYPIGNADCCRIDLDGGQMLLFDYADVANSEDPKDRRMDLPTALRAELKAAGRDYFDVVAISHLDSDHICGASEFFHLEHNDKYTGKGRVKIRELWVPAAVIIEEQCDDEAKVIQDEARYRLQKAEGIRVFSRPDLLKSWLDKSGIRLEDIAHLVTDAGQTVPTYTKTNHGVEFFVHSPFATRVNEAEVVDRNKDSLVLQACFLRGGRETRLILSADVTHEILADIVKVTRYHKRDERLAWDIIKLPHHCSYRSLSNNKGTGRTEPIPEVKWLFDQGASGGIIVSTSWPILTEATVQPPHREAANYYRKRSDEIGGTFRVTMEHPSVNAPRPLVITVGESSPSIGGSAQGDGSKQRGGGPSVLIESHRDIREAPPFA